MLQKIIYIISKYDIFIKVITENCGYSSATFYRQFKDKYDLIAWWCRTMSFFAVL
ncbi:MAG: TetR/AcrR family transcriptional regulator [Lachnospiraceae bacterium]|nr:TetR/AcrR family transcriptional regulator [Lachnospiraceae bacterium]